MSELPTGSGVDLIVEDFKCLRGEHRFELRGLTVLAGANSSGKSSAVQPVLLLKQTLQSQIDPPGALRLDGPLVDYSSPAEFLWRRAESGSFGIGLRVASREVRSAFVVGSGSLTVQACAALDSDTDGTVLRGELSANDGREAVAAFLRTFHGREFESVELLAKPVTLAVHQLRFSLVARASASGVPVWGDPWPNPTYTALAKVIHVPGFRGNPDRRYPLAAAHPQPSGQFAREYTAGFLLAWQQAEDPRLGDVSAQLSAMDLTGHVEVVQNDGVSVSILVGRLPANGRKTKDLVNIADVGFGVSQVLPVLVALLAAEPGQIVHLEQPELHLHPEAQARLGQVIVEAVQRGVLVVIETHSPLLLLAIQIALASGDVAPEQARLYWFERDKRGAAKITPGRLDEHGRYDKWPVDFWEVERQRYGVYVHKFMQAPGQAAG